MEVLNEMLVAGSAWAAEHLTAPLLGIAIVLFGATVVWENLKRMWR